MSRTSARRIIVRLWPRLCSATVAASTPPLGQELTHMPIESSRFTALAAIGVATLACGACVAAAAERPISLTQKPLVMRLSKNEFRIAFGLKSAQDSPNGCSGVIRYRVAWKTDDGPKPNANKRT